MRKHDVRKWLHAILDLLPVLLIPVFMIYSHRHTLTERTEVDIHYKYQSNEVNSYDDLVEGNIYHFKINNETIDSFLYGDDTYNFKLLYVYTYNLVDYESDLSLNDYNLNETIAGLTDIYLYFDGWDCYINIYLNDNEDNNPFMQYHLGNFADNDLTFDAIIQLYNKGNNIDVYNNLLTYTDYNVIESVDVQDTNSDIMSVFIDDFNNAIDKYFNMGNVFNLNGVYQWFNTNIFSGHAPTVIYSIWNIALYELCMDLLFLLYGLFMWFIDMVEKIMDKPFKSIK